MAMYDWNGNGTNNDMGDNFIDYEIREAMTGGEKHPPCSSKRGISTFGTVISVAAGLVLQAAIYVAMDIDVEKVPVIVIVILWIVISVAAGVVLDKLGV